MNGVVLVDSSAWIEAVRAGGDPEMERQVGNLIGTGRAAMTVRCRTTGFGEVRGEVVVEMKG